MVDQENLDVLLDSPVTNIEMADRPGKKHKVYLGNSDSPQKFDALIITARPHDAIKFLHEGTPVADLYDKVTADPVETYLVKVEKIDDSSLAKGELPGTIALYPPAVTLGSRMIKSIADGTPIGVQQLDSYANRHMVAVGYCSNDISSEQAASNMKQTLSGAGLDVKKIVHQERFEYPAKVPFEDAKNGWFQALEELQGQNNVFFAGEALAGAGVPAQLKFVKYYVPLWFPPVDSKHTTEKAKEKEEKQKKREEKKALKEQRNLWAATKNGMDVLKNFMSDWESPWKNLPWKNSP
jgi:predicted NAD/FAD-binding protein